MRNVLALLLAALVLASCKAEPNTPATEAPAAPQQSTAAPTQEATASDTAQTTETAAAADQSNPKHYKIPLPKNEILISVIHDGDAFYIASREETGGQHYRAFNGNGQLLWDVDFSQ